MNGDAPFLAVHAQLGDGVAPITSASATIPSPRERGHLRIAHSLMNASGVGVAMPYASCCWLVRF